MSLNTKPRGTFLVVQWLKLHTSTAGGTVWISDWIMIPHAMSCGQNKQSTKPFIKYTLDFKVLALTKNRTFMTIL